jgi:hypothetical protein
MIKLTGLCYAMIIYYDYLLFYFLLAIQSTIISIEKRTDYLQNMEKKYLY